MGRQCPLHWKYGFAFQIGRVNSTMYPACLLLEGSFRFSIALKKLVHSNCFFLCCNGQVHYTHSFSELTHNNRRRLQQQPGKKNLLSRASLPFIITSIGGTRVKRSRLTWRIKQLAPIDFFPLYLDEKNKNNGKIKATSKKKFLFILFSIPALIKRWRNLCHHKISNTVVVAAAAVLLAFMLPLHTTKE